MIKKLVFFILTPLLLLAFVLALNGIHHIELDNTYYDLIRLVNIRMSSFKIEIPQIPQIPYQSMQGGFDILEVLIGFVNGLVNFLNILVTIVNLVISALQFVITFFVTISEYVFNLVKAGVVA